MSWGGARLGDIAPSKPLRNPVIIDKNNTWQLNLDMVEAQTGKIIDKEKANILEAGSSTHWFDSRHVLYSKLRPYLNKVVLPDEQGLATTELVPLLPDSQRLDRSYLVHYLRSKQFVNWITEQVAGAKMPRVSMKVFWDHEIPLPYPNEPNKSLTEQKRIASILDKADVIRCKRQQSIQLADDFLRSIFLDMFDAASDNKTIQELLDENYLVLHKDGNHGSNYPRKSEFVESGVPFISAKDISEEDGTIDYENISYLTEKKAKQLTIGWLENGDVLLAHNATVGRVGYFDGAVPKAIIGTSLTAFRANPKKLSPMYLFAALKYSVFQTELRKNMGQSTRNQVPITTQRTIKVPLGNSDKQLKFQILFNQVMLNKERLTKSMSESENMFYSLSQKAFSGQL